MSNDQTPFMAQTVLLDGYIRSENPTSDPAALEVVLAVLREKPELRQYFFRSQPSPAWATILWSNNFLTKAPEPKKEGDKTTFQYWDAQEYLISVAQQAPEILVRHVQNIQGHAWYKGRAMLGIQYIPTEFLTDVMPIVLGWLSESESRLAVADDGYRLMIALAKQKNRASLEILRRITAPFPPQQIKKVSGIIINAEASSVFPDLRWGRDFDNNLSLLNEVDAAQVVSILEEQLCASLRIEAEAKGSPEYEYKLSSWWRPAIEDTSQNIRDDLKNLLLEGLRDSLEFLRNSNRAALIEILERYSNDGHEILRRLRLHILQKFPLEFADEVTHDLLFEQNYDDTGIHHEFFMLLKHGFVVLDNEHRQAATQIILEGPPQENVESFIQWVTDNESEQREEAVNSYVKRWIRDRLSTIAEHLDEERLSLLGQITEEFGEPEHADFTHWTGEAFFVSDVSPLPAEQLGSMTATELKSFLDQWQPDRNRMFGPEVISYRGLGKVLAAVIEKELAKYSEYFVSIGLLRPEFAYALLGEQRQENETVAKMSNDSWPLYFDLCEAIVADEHLAKDMNRASEINWRDVRSAMVTFIAAGLKKKEDDDGGNISTQNMIRARDVLIKLTNDPDPLITENEANDDSFPGDPLTSSLNHVRSQALGALIEQYSRYIARVNQAKGIYGSLEGAGPNRLDSEVEKTLTTRLARREESSLAVHSVYGRNLSTLYWLNKTWVQRYLDQILPEESDSSYFVAAWDSYVVFNRPHRELFDLLESRYQKAIENLSRGLVTRTHLEPDRSLASHLLGNYLYGDFELRSQEGQSSLLALFFGKAPADTRGSAIWILWNTLKSRPDEKTRLWPKAREIWRWRIDVASSNNHSNEFDSELSWFPYLLEFAPETETITSIWPLLEGILPHLGRARRFGSEWEEIEKYLLREIEKEPLKVIRFYRLMHEIAGRPAWFLEHNEKTILEVGLSHIESRDATLSLIDLISSMGDLSYRDLYEKYAR
jgi:hypothetical protein